MAKLYNQESHSQYIVYLDALKAEGDVAGLYNALSYEQFCVFKGLFQYIDENPDFKNDAVFKGSTPEYEKLGGAHSDGLTGVLQSKNFEDMRKLVQEQKETTAFLFRGYARNICDNKLSGIVLGAGVGMASRLVLTGLMGSFAPALAIAILGGAATGGIMAALRVYRMRKTWRLQGGKQLTRGDAIWEVFKGATLGAFSAMAFAIGTDVLLNGLTAHADPQAPADASTTGVEADGSAVEIKSEDAGQSSGNANPASGSSGTPSVTANQGDVAVSIHITPNGDVLTEAAYAKATSTFVYVGACKVSVYDFLYNPDYAHASYYDLNLKEAAASYNLDHCKIGIDAQDPRDAFKTVVESNGLEMTPDCSVINHTDAYIETYNGEAIEYGCKEINNIAPVIIGGKEVSVYDFVYNPIYADVKPTDVIFKNAALSLNLDPCMPHIDGQDLRDAFKVQIEQNGLHMSRDGTTVTHIIGGDKVVLGSATATTPKCTCG